MNNDLIFTNEQKSPNKTFSSDPVSSLNMYITVLCVVISPISFALRWQRIKRVSLFIPLHATKQQHDTLGLFQAVTYPCILVAFLILPWIFL